MDNPPCVDHVLNRKPAVFHIFVLLSRAVTTQVAGPTRDEVEVEASWWFGQGVLLFGNDFIEFIIYVGVLSV